MDRSNRPLASVVAIDPPVNSTGQLAVHSSIVDSPNAAVRDINAHHGAEHRFHVISYITKPVQLTEFLTVVKSIDAFWPALVRLPPQIEP